MMTMGYRSRRIVARFGGAKARVAEAGTGAGVPAPRHDLPAQVFRTTRVRPLRWVALAVGIAACAYLGHAAYIHAKARLAQHLIASAWAETQATGRPARPWPWADVHPVARLSVPRLSETMVVLAGDSGRSLAFAPGHRTGTPLPGTNGNAVVSAHRDTHFAFLRDVKPGDRVLVETAAGATRAYRIVSAEIAHKDRLDLLADRHRPELTLVTCWPFDAVAANGPLRYVVKAVAEAGGPPGAPVAKAGGAAI